MNDVEKAVGHVIDTVAERHYKINKKYIRRLAPYIEQLGAILENTEKAV